MRVWLLPQGNRKCRFAGEIGWGVNIVDIWERVCHIDGAVRSTPERTVKRDGGGEQAAAVACDAYMCLRLRLPTVL